MADLPIQIRDDTWYRDVPRSIKRQAIFGLALLAFALGGFGLWAFTAPLTAAVIAQGSFVATGQNKIVQHLEGGIIAEILVKEGDRVERGDMLLRLDQTLAEATSRELDLRRVRLEATQARLLAEHRRLDTLEFPAHLEARRSDPEISVILDGQRVAFDVARSGARSDISLVMRNIDALDMRAGGYRTQLDALKRQAALLTEEHEDKESLLEEGLIRRTEVLALQRAVLESEGQIGRVEAELGEIAEMRNKFETQIIKTQDEYSRVALGQLETIQSELESIREQARKAANILGRTDVIAPVSGTVVRMHYHTTGGVIETGRAIAEILPADAPLIIEVLIPRTEIDQVTVGQAATVRLAALNQRTTPVLNGVVDYVSADTVSNTTNERVRDVYLAHVTVPQEELQRVHAFSPTPGMPAEIMIQTTERTFAQYIMKPILDSMARAFREQ